MTKNTLFYSIIVPVYNGEAEIGMCLRALCQQTIPAHQYEIIVVDDGSTDQTRQVAAQAAQVRIFSQANVGPAAARNFGARNARGDILVFTDADCRPEQNWLEEMVNPFSDPEVVGVKGIYKTAQQKMVARFVQLEYETKYDRMARADKIDFIDTYSAAYRKSVFLLNHGFEELFKRPSVEDQEFSFRLARKGYRLVFTPKAAVFHQHDQSIGEYFRRKLGIGYWKAVMLHWLPEKMISDSHTLPSQKIQILLLAAMILGICLSWMGFPFNWVFPAALLLFLGVDGSFFRKIIKRDPKLLIAAPILLVTRALALGLGLASGFLFPPKNIRSAEPGLSFMERAVKRIVDICGALVGLILFLPVIVIAAIAIKLDSRGPVFFIQQRAGATGKPFNMIKLRTMVEDAPLRIHEVLERSLLKGPVYKIHNDPRVTRVGRVLRRWSLDELPQFWNVLTGVMSLVGPRPEELWLVQQYNDSERRRLLVKPGLTGPMQVNGRGDLDMDKRMQLEMAYIEDYSLMKDLFILVNSLPVIIEGKGAY